jgi:hypothetical protein
MACRTGPGVRASCGRGEGAAVAAGALTAGMGVDGTTSAEGGAVAGASDDSANGGVTGGTAREA